MNQKLQLKLFCVLASTFFLSYCTKEINTSNTTFCINNNCDANTVDSIIANGQSKVKFELATTIKAYEGNIFKFSISNGFLAPLNYTSTDSLKNTLTVTANNGKAGGYIIAPKTADDFVTITCNINDKLVGRKLKL